MRCYACKREVTELFEANPLGGGGFPQILVCADCDQQGLLIEGPAIRHWEALGQKPKREVKPRPRRWWRE